MQDVWFRGRIGRGYGVKNLLNLGRDGWVGTHKIGKLWWVVLLYDCANKYRDGMVVVALFL